MEIGLFTCGYQRSDLEQAFHDARRFGYDFIELWGGRPHAFPYDLMDGGYALIQSLSEKYQMPIKVYTPEMNAYLYNMMQGTEAMRIESVEYVCASMDIAKKLNAEYTLISAGHAGYQLTKREINQRLIKTLREIEDYARKINHKVILEPLTPFESNVIVSANDLQEALHEVDSPHLLGMVDVVVPFVIHEPIMSYFEKMGEKIVHMHVIDSDGTSDSHLIPLEGKIPLKELMNEVKQLDFAPSVTIELVTAYLNEPTLYAKRAIDNLKSMLE